jgi:ClpP class serine protease
LGIASREIWDELMQVKASGKPVIASMGNVAASGGYYIAGGALIHIADCCFVVQTCWPYLAA